MDDEFLKALKMVEEYDRQRPTSITEYRLYYDDEGRITMYCEQYHPDSGNYIVIDHPDIFFKNQTDSLRVIDGKLRILDLRAPQLSRLRKSQTGQPVVKGMAGLPLAPNETYENIEYYDKKFN